MNSATGKHAAIAGGQRVLRQTCDRQTQILAHQVMSSCQLIALAKTRFVLETTCGGTSSGAHWAGPSRASSMSQQCDA